MKVIIAIATFGTTAFATENLHIQYSKYLAQHRKNYLTTEEYELRFINFAKTHYAIEKHNAEGKSWTLAHNTFSDWTEAEKKALNGYIPTTRVFGEKSQKKFAGKNQDYTYLNSVKNVKNQGSCGSCWAFSTTGSIESRSELRNDSFTPLSEQQLIDCSKDNNGCSGGTYVTAFPYAAKYGLESEDDYPYQMADGTCAYDATKATHHDVYPEVPLFRVNPGDINAFLAELERGPVSIAIEADQDAFQLYKGGVLANDGSCGTRLDHAVLAVGNGNEGGLDYVLVKNSWGSNWGEGGFVKLGYSNGTAACGFLNDPAGVNV